MECSSSDEEKHLEMSENSKNIYVNLDTNENNTETAVPIGHMDRQTDGPSHPVCNDELTDKQTHRHTDS